MSATSTTERCRDICPTRKLQRLGCGDENGSSARFTCLAPPWSEWTLACRTQRCYAVYCDMDSPKNCSDRVDSLRKTCGNLAPGQADTSATVWSGASLSAGPKTCQRREEGNQRTAPPAMGNPQHQVKKNKQAGNSKTEHNSGGTFWHCRAQAQLTNH